MFYSDDPVILRGSGREGAIVRQMPANGDEPQAFYEVAFAAEGAPHLLVAEGDLIAAAHADPEPAAEPAAETEPESEAPASSEPEAEPEPEPEPEPAEEA